MPQGPPGDGRAGGRPPRQQRTTGKLRKHALGPRLQVQQIVCRVSGKNEQPFQPWTVGFLAPAEVVGDAHDILRELHLKLPDPARAYLNRRYPATGAAQPELREALASLTSEFGLKYEESILMAGDYKYQHKRGNTSNDVMRALIAARERYDKYQRKRGDTGSDIIRALTAARERAAGIPAVSDEVEDRYYVFEWNLTAA